MKEDLRQCRTHPILSPLSQDLADCFSNEIDTNIHFRKEVVIDTVY